VKLGPRAAATFLHRDFHPTNVLFRRGRVSGVVDWVNACRGPAGVDVAHCRVNLVLLSGPDVADRFLDAYRRAAPGYEHDPLYDVAALLDSALPSPAFYQPWRAFGAREVPVPELRRRAEAQLARVLGRLG
jgi:aminoglycoside/choline kinase family phosphotransferase